MKEMIKTSDRLAKQTRKESDGISASEARQIVRKACKDHDYNPLESLILALKQKVPVLGPDGVTQVKDQDGKPMFMPVLDPKEAIGIHKEILKYYLPQLRAVDIDAKVGMDFNVTVVKLADLIEEDTAEKEIQ